MDMEVVGVSSSQSSHHSTSKGRKSFLIDSLLEERQRKLLAGAASNRRICDGRENSSLLCTPSWLGATKKAPYQLHHSGHNSPAVIPEPEEPSFPPTDPSPSPVSTLTPHSHSAHAAGSANGHSVYISDPMNNYTSFMELIAKFAKGNAFKQAVDPLQGHTENVFTEERLIDVRRPSTKKACKAAQQDSPGNTLPPPLPFAVISQQAFALVGGMTNPAYMQFLQQQYAAFLQSLWNPLLTPVLAGGKKPTAGAFGILTSSMSQIMNRMVYAYGITGTLPPSFSPLFMNTSKKPTSGVISQLTSHRLRHEGSGQLKFKTSPTPVTKMRMPLNTYQASKSAASAPSYSSSSGSSSNVKKYRCDICNKTFSRSNTLITHKRIHTGEKPFKCQHCGRAFRQPGNLTRHAYTHTTVKPFICEECGKAFNRASNLHTHMKTHSADGQDDE